MLLSIAGMWEKTMTQEIVHITDNGVKRVSPVSPLPAWLAPETEPTAVVAVVAAVAPVAAPTVAPEPFPRDGGDWDSAIEPPRPCPQCGGLALWWDLRGDCHCQQCEADTFQRARRLTDKARRLRAIGKGKAA
jgi:hypothetical protein